MRRRQVRANDAFVLESALPGRALGSHPLALTSHPSYGALAMTEQAGFFLRMVALILVVLGGVFALPGCQKYDQLIEADQLAQARWADVEAELERRASLVPNLVNTV